jgi:hypothetical protein
MAQVQVTAPPTGNLPPALGSPGGPGTVSEDSAGKTTGGTNATGPGKPNFKELRLDAQTGGVNSYVRVGPSLNGQGQNQNQNLSGTTGSGQRTGGELFKIGGNIKF